MSLAIAYTLGSLLKYITLVFVAYWALRGVRALIRAFMKGWRG